VKYFNEISFIWKKPQLYKGGYLASGRKLQIGNTFKISTIGIPRAEQVREWLGKLVQCLIVKVFYKALLSALLLFPQDP